MGGLDNSALHVDVYIENGEECAGVEKNEGTFFFDGKAVGVFKGTIKYACLRWGVFLHMVKVSNL